MQAEIVRVKTALEMLAEVERLAPEADVIIGAAAVADYRPAERVSGKCAGGRRMTLKLVPNPDILAAAVAKLSRVRRLSALRPSRPITPTSRARNWRPRASRRRDERHQPNGRGFESDNNELTLLSRMARRSRAGTTRSSNARCGCLSRFVSKKRRLLASSRGKNSKCVNQAAAPATVTIAIGREPALDTLSERCVRCPPSREGI